MANWRFVTLVACMMIGTASLPHILMRYFTTPSVRAARASVAWSLLFIFLLYFTSPALATFTKLQVLDPNLATSVIGKSLAQVNALEWVQKWSSVGFLKVIDRRTLAFADFRGNRQFITQGNLADNPRTMLFLLDYETRQRIKIWGLARVVEDDRLLLRRLTPPDYRATVDAAILVEVAAWDANCPSHIRRLVEAEAAP